MTTTTAMPADEALTVTCPRCENGLSIEIGSPIERTDYNPDGIIDATCGQCGEHFTVGFRRQH